MLLTELILSKRGPLAKVWLSAHHERKLSKQQTLGVDVEESVGECYVMDLVCRIDASGGHTGARGGRRRGREDTRQSEGGARITPDVKVAWREADLCRCYSYTR